MVEDLAEDDKPRTDFLKACLLKLGLKVSQETTAVPSLSRLHLSSMLPNGASHIMDGLQEIVSIKDGEEYIKDENDTFHLEKPSTWSFGSLAKNLTGETDEKTDNDGDDDDRIIDYNAIIKRLIVHEKEPPPSKETPYFNHDAFYANLKHYKNNTQEGKNDFGHSILYGEVVTSTNTLLEKYVNPHAVKELAELSKVEIPRYFVAFQLALQRPLQFKWLDEVVALMYGFLLPGRLFSPLSFAIQSP